MAKFEIAEAITGRNEGLYANNTADKGGETYAGIARNFWPKWEGWTTIDEIKRTKGKTAAVINANAKSNTLLTRQISDFYKANFWDVIRLDFIKDQQIANTVYDFAVNSGVARAAKYLQMAFNAVDESTKDDIKVDGQVGSKTISAVNSADPEDIHRVYNALRESFYRSIAKGNQAQFLKSWLSRLKTYKK